MSSKTMLIGLSIFRCGHEKSVHGRPSWELAPFDCTSQITEDFASWCKLVSKQCCSSGCAEECGVVHVSTQFFILDKAKALPIRIGSQTVWQAIRLEFIDNKDKMIAKDYELHDRSPHFSTFEVGRFGRGITTCVFGTGEALSNEYRKFSQ
ncbi:unnamed protein product [Pocillopora meandrina]|uniref:Uncharacterized protein n=1 Tax=Pocillopora meandrina TaxID=46732 RepID=A0AAU9VM94_9CNID|nr:unnamed protein product [Pocillopora meandrina]